MQIQVDNDVFDVEVLANGDWLFRWKDKWDGASHHIYRKEQVHKFLIVEQVWQIIPEVKVEQKAPDYAAAFDMWQDDYINNPQAYESAYDTALNHLKEKLEGKEPSYGTICAKMFEEYLEKVE